MNDTRNSKTDKKQHIQVFVRIRPPNNVEKAGKSASVLDIPSPKEVLVHERLQDKFTKKFTFDRVFGPQSKQVDVYNAVVSPLLSEVLDGYNCTVFAYGQTGSGKTFTMEGINDDPSLHWQTDSAAGIIPRTFSHLFDTLRTLDIQEYMMNVSFLELYNEEIFDLLSSTHDSSKIRLYDDSTKKGAVIVHGIDEVTVHNKGDVFKLLQQGTERRQTAATLMNAHSSRSHTIFSINIHIKENTVDGEELLKTGKFNLVDLAGSENIGRSGAVDRRAKEAGNINQSLLTLSRVITALVERTPHIPYRESKLTRLLQESLGGRTKTSIIATVSPAAINLEETLSTLYYVHRAKNITNRPEINQKLSKKALLLEYADEIERLRAHLMQTSERNGIYIALENYNEVQNTIERQDKSIEEKVNHIKALEKVMKDKEQIFNDLQSQYNEQSNELRNMGNQLDITTHALQSMTARVEMTKQEKEEQKHLVEKHVSTENLLLSQAQTLMNVADVATEDVRKLHDKICRIQQLEQQNNHCEQKFKSDVKKEFQGIEADVSSYTKEFSEFCTTTGSEIDTQAAAYSENIDRSVQIFSENLLNSDKSDKVQKNIENSYARYQEWLEKETADATDTTERECHSLTNIFSRVAQEIQPIIADKFSEELQQLNNDCSQNLDNARTFANSSLESVCTYELANRDRLLDNVKQIKRNVDDLLEKQTKMKEKRESFVKLMGELQLRLSELREEEEENHSSVCDTVGHINEMCNNVTSQASNTCTVTTDRERSFAEQIQNDLRTITNDVAKRTEECWTVADETVLQTKNLVHELQADLSKTCERLANYGDRVENSSKGIRQTMTEDRNLILESVNNVHRTICDATDDHVGCLESLKNTFTNESAEIGRKIETETANMAQLNQKITTRLETVRDRVDKFFAKELQRDVPTGATPAKKEFHYPKKLVRTSPHERIIQRFRETNKNNDAFENESIPVLNNNTPVKRPPIEVGELC